MLKEGELPIDVLLDNVKRNPSAILRATNVNEKMKIPQIVMTCATKDIWCSTTRRMKTIMEEVGIPFYYNESIDGEHDFVEFDKGFRYAFQKIFEY